MPKPSASFATTLDALEAAGEITRERRGSNGFGFDPVMYLPEHGQTFAEMPNELKNQRSHRGQAARLMVKLIQERWLA